MLEKCFVYSLDLKSRRKSPFNSGQADVARAHPVIFGFSLGLREMYQTGAFRSQHLKLHAPWAALTHDHCNIVQNISAKQSGGKSDASKAQGAPEAGQKPPCYHIPQAVVFRVGVSAPWPSFAPSLRSAA